jgi:hypothetical protein
MHIIKFERVFGKIIETALKGTSQDLASRIQPKDVSY